MLLIYHYRYGEHENHKERKYSVYLVFMYVVLAWSLSIHNDPASCKMIKAAVHLNTCQYSLVYFVGIKKIFQRIIFKE